MRKFKVVKLSGIDEEIGLKVGDIVDFKHILDELYLFKLPKHLWGNGHKGFGEYKKPNYWFLEPKNLEEVE